jgi:hypothetical protein
VLAALLKMQFQSGMAELIGLSNRLPAIAQDGQDEATTTYNSKEIRLQFIQGLGVSLTVKSNQ